MIKRSLLLYIILLFNNQNFSQNNQLDFYREDQFYINIFYNSIKNGVDELKENKFSSSINFGFIRDFPLNNSGKFSLGLGAGLGINSINNNLKLNSNFLNYTDINDDVKKNKFNYSEIQFPLEIRFRNSSIDSYRFWRLYAGVMYSRIVNSKFKFENYIEKYSQDNTPITRDQLGFTLNIGFNTWNLGIYKSVRPFFANQDFSNFKLFKLGLVFYIF